MWKVALLVMTIGSVARADPYVPVYQPIDPMTFHRGITVEFTLGGGTSVETTATGIRPQLQQALGVGVWLDPRLAIMARSTSLFLTTDSERTMIFVVGGGLQWWLSDHAWLGLDVGLAPRLPEFRESDLGASVDARIGYSLSTNARAERPSPAHAIAFSFSVANAMFSGDDNVVTASLFLGYQYL